jgi:uncharacterized protein (DUF2235 family)
MSDATQGKTIVICCDGTWNTPRDKTNVWRAYQILGQALGGGGHETPLGDDRKFTEGTAGGRPFVIYYDEGVGTTAHHRLEGGAFATGLSLNIKQAYDFLLEHWQPEDRLFCLGFSRGAFSVRSFCGLLGAAGLPQGLATETERQQAVECAFAYYRLAPADRAGSREAAALEGYRRASPSVRFLGVWDTVGSLGVPLPNLPFINGKLLADKIRFHDTALGGNVQTACQAIATSERRGLFKPVLWSRAPGQAKAEDGSTVPQKVLQVWFTGAHGDVGGGYEVSDLPLIALDWMLRRAMDAKLGLDLEPALATLPRNPLGPRHASEADWLGRLTSGEISTMVLRVVGDLPFARLLPLQVLGGLANLFAAPNYDRPMGGECLADDGTFSVGYGERIHESVLDRFRPRCRPANVDLAVESGLPIFRERREIRRPMPSGTMARIDGQDVEIQDLSPSGARLGKVRRLKVGIDYPFKSNHVGDITANVVWAEMDRAGVRFLQ